MNPHRVAEAAARLGLKHVVITSVTRDDLPDGGAEHFYQCVLAVRERTGAAVEVLTPDFLGNTAAIDRVIEARPEVFNHNTETVPRLYDRVRRNAVYRRTLDLLKRVKNEAPNDAYQKRPDVGIGRDPRRSLGSLRRLARRSVATCSPWANTCNRRPPICRSNAIFRRKNLTKSAIWPGAWVSLVASGPFVRSSYHAGEMTSRVE